LGGLENGGNSLVTMVALCYFIIARCHRLRTAGVGLVRPASLGCAYLTRAARSFSATESDNRICCDTRWMLTRYRL
jgi:hypothetical protein